MRPFQLFAIYKLQAVRDYRTTRSARAVSHIFILFPPRKRRSLMRAPPIHFCLCSEVVLYYVNIVHTTNGQLDELLIVGMAQTRDSNIMLLAMRISIVKCTEEIRNVLRKAENVRVERKYTRAISTCGYLENERHMNLLGDTSFESNGKKFF